MSTPVTCPRCGSECELPADGPAGEVKCPTCGGVLVAVGAAPITTRPAPPPLPKAGPDTEADDLMPCPHCGERILRNSTFCRFCREHVEGEMLPWERGRRVPRDVEPHRGNLILVLGILGFVIPLVGLGFAIAAWVMGRRDVARMDRMEMDPRGKGTTQAGFICGIVATVLQTLLLLGCVAYIFLIYLFLSIATRSMPVPAARPMPAAPAPPPPGKVQPLPGGALRLQDYLPRC
jgi:DNA-directed RNA polymerase subunit RPC12/RpoP